MSEAGENAEGIWVGKWLDNGEVVVFDPAHQPPDAKVVRLYRCSGGNFVEFLPGRVEGRVRRFPDPSGHANEIAACVAARKPRAPAGKAAPKRKSAKGQA